MQSIKCKNRQCGNNIAFINGNVPSVTCDKCGTIRKLYHAEKSRGMKLTISTTVMEKMLAKPLSV